jgi:hypothetical protein
VKEIVQKEWEKAQRPMYQISDYHNQEEGEKSDRSGLADFSMEGDSDSNAEVEEDDKERIKRDKSSEGFQSARLPRDQGKDGRNLNSPYPTMENLQTCSANNLRLFLTKIRNLNARNLFSKAPTANRSI